MKARAAIRMALGPNAIACLVLMGASQDWSVEQTVMMLQRSTSGKKRRWSTPLGPRGEADYQPGGHEFDHGQGRRILLHSKGIKCTWCNAEASLCSTAHSRLAFY